VKWCKNLSSNERLLKATIIAIGLRGMLRQSELANINKDSIQVKNKELIIHLGVTKTN
jgi:hypothetical protein